MTDAGILTFAAYLTASLARLPLVSLAGCMVSGLAVGIMWPGSISLTSARMPGGGTALFALLWLGVRKITIGPKMPENFSANIEAVLENTFGLTEAGSPEEDRKAMFADLEVKKKGFSGNTKITGDMLIGELVRTYPEVVPLLLTVGMHCVGCGSSAYESLTEACTVHGLNPDEVIEFINREMSGE